MEHSLLARQPIYNQKLEVIAYELLFRADEITQNSQVDMIHGIPGDNATELMLNSFHHLQIDKIAGNHLAFINFTQNLLLKNAYLQLPKDKVVIEILENIQFDQTTLAAIYDMVEEGYTIALDDFIYKEELIPLLKLATYVKVDVIDMSREDIEAAIAPLKQYQVLLLAEKIEDEATYQHCIDLGFHYYQGYYFSRPKLVSKQRIEFAERLIRFLLVLLADPTQDASALQHFTESYRKLDKQVQLILKHYGISKPSEVADYNVIVHKIGYKTLLEIVIACALQVTDSKPHGLMKSALIRARMCEVLAIQAQENMPEHYFLLGIVSILHRFFDQNYVDFIKSIALINEHRTALLYNKDQMGDILHNVRAYSHANISEFAPSDPKLDYQDAYLNSVSWFDELLILFTDKNGKAT